MRDTEINDAIERLVRIGSSDRDALVTALRDLAGLVDHDLRPKADDGDLPLILHGSHGGSVQVANGGHAYVAPCGHYSPTMSMTGLFSAINCPGCIKALSNDGYETNADPKPQRGDHGICATCGGGIEYWDHSRWNGLEDDVLDAQWSHHVHPADGHDAVLGGLA